jgi:KUP system potassium uptake protein
MRRIWHWRRAIVVPLVALFLAIDLTYFIANLTKLTQGGWIPLLIAIVLFHLMTVWHAGLDALHHRMRGENCETCLSLLRKKKIPRVPGTAIFLTRQRHDVPALLSQHIAHMGALQEHVVTLTVTPTGKPWVADDARATVRNLGQGLWRVTIRFGFLEQRALLPALKNVRELKDMDLENVVWFGARDLVVRDPVRPRLNRVDLTIFGFLLRNAVKTMDHFAIPPKNFVEVAREIRI